MKQANTRMKSPKPSAQQGYTLVELMVAIMVIAISVLALYQMLITGRTFIQEENHRRLGLERVQYHLTALKSIAIDSGYVPTRYARSFAEEVIPPTPDQEDGIDGEFTISITPSRERNSDDKPIYSDVIVEVTWPEKSGRQQSLKLGGSL